MRILSQVILIAFFLILTSCALNEVLPKKSQPFITKAGNQQEDAETQYNLGVIYYAYAEVPQDYQKACEWFLLPRQ